MEYEYTTPSPVKALGNGKVGGYLVIFTGPNSPDLQGEYFTKSTDFFIDNGETRPILYRHGAHPVIKSRKLGKATLTVDDVGVFLEGELNLRDNYEKGIYKLAEEGKLGWSSGSMGHLVTKKPNGKSLEIVTWPIGEASLTPNPVEGRTMAATKSLEDEPEILDDYIKECEQQESDNGFVLAGIPAIARFCESVAPTSLKDGSQRSEAAVDAGKEFVTIAKIFGEGIYSYASRLVRRSENRFLKSARDIHPSTVKDVEDLLGQLDQMQAPIDNIKSALTGILKISQMSHAEQKALDERARFELWNFCRITGTVPEELKNV